MPPLRTGRASKACDLCRKYKTRCYASDSSEGTCLRCQTLCQPCSLHNESFIPRSESFPPNTIHQRQIPTADEQSNISKSAKGATVDERLERLEGKFDILLDRLDGLDSRPRSLTNSWNIDPPQVRATESINSTEQNPVPVLLIRDAAKDAGVHSPDEIESASVPHNDVISTGLVALPTANSLLELFHTHYGRWVKFPERISTTNLLPRVRQSPLLLCSVFLIAVRHTNQALADRLAPQLFQEAKALIATSLLTVPQTFEFFQATLILSLWSTTIGQMPLSIDSWLLTGYALQQASASPDFAHIFRADQTHALSKIQINAWCLWNHICLAHLQYCIGTRRRSIVDETQINNCIALVDTKDLTNFEARMVAEIKLYWIIYRKCCGSSVDLRDSKLHFERWKQQSATLLEQSRSQFLRMGYHFAHLLAYSRSLKSSETIMQNSNVEEMVEHSTTIINLAMDTTDDRTRHLTDQIFHMVTFSALMLCRLIYTHQPEMQSSPYDLESAQNLIVKLIDWLKGIGLPCHAAYMLGDIVSAYSRKLSAGSSNTNVHVNYSVTGDDSSALGLDEEYLSTDLLLLYPHFIGSEFLDIDTEEMPWP